MRVFDDGVSSALAKDSLVKEALGEEFMALSEGQVHASGIVLQHYAEPDKDTGICLPSWRVTSSSVVYSPNLGSGTATTVNGEIYVRGERAYKFQADVATIDAVSHPHPVLQVLGNLKVAEKTTGATLHCKVLTWEAVSQILRLGSSGNKRTRISSISGGSGSDLCTVGVSHTSAAAVLSAVGDGQRLPPSRGQSQNIGQSVCHTHVKVPGTYLNGIGFSLNLKSWATEKLCAISAVFGRIMKRTFELSCKSSLALLPARMQRLSPATVSCRNKASPRSHTVDVIVNAEEGLIFDLANGRISSPGFLSLSCPTLQSEVQAGAGEVLLHKDTSMFLQRGVSAKVQGFHLQAQRLYFSMSDGDAHFKTGGLNLSSVHTKPPMESEVQLKQAESGLVCNGDMKSFPPSAVGRFNSRFNQLKFRSPGLEVHRRPMTACCYAKCGSFDSSRIVLQRNKPLGNMTRLVQTLSKQLFSALHVSLKTSQIRNLAGIEFVVSDWFASSPKILLREDVDQETFLSAFKMSGTDVLIAEGDVRIWWQ